MKIPQDVKFAERIFYASLFLISTRVFYIKANDIVSTNYFFLKAVFIGIVLFAAWAKCLLTFERQVHKSFAEITLFTVLSLLLGFCVSSVIFAFISWIGIPFGLSAGIAEVISLFFAGFCFLGAICSNENEEAKKTSVSDEKLKNQQEVKAEESEPNVEFATVVSSSAGEIARRNYPENFDSHWN